MQFLNELLTVQIYRRIRSESSLLVKAIRKLKSLRSFKCPFRLQPTFSVENTHTKVSKNLTKNSIRKGHLLEIEMIIIRYLL